MKIAANATPGHYFFFCLNHGPFMSGWVDIKPKSAKIASQDTLTREARKEIDAKLSVLRGTHNLALADRFPVPSDRLAAVQKLGVPTAVVDGTTVVRAWFAGLPHTGTDDASILQFVPTHPKVRVGQKVSFLFLGGPTQGHTVSFDVPAYFPVFTVEKDGTIVRNAQLDQPAGGSPKLPDSVTGGGENNNGPPPPPVVIDGGTWNGHGFFSSGLISPASFALYTLRFSKPGTYKFACLVHPLMVGTLTVTA
jgi:plastocyanin